MTDHFFIVGAQRSGTTYLYRLLAEHPDIEMARPERPEPKFFLEDDLFARGLAFYEQQFFLGKPGARLRGEKSTSYIESEKAASRIARTFPNARIVFLLRDPVERAISNYWFSVNNGLETLPMDEAFRREDERWQQYDHERLSTSPFAYLRRGRYSDFIETYLRFFPPAQLIVRLYERLVDRVDAVQEIFAVLGASPNFMPTSLRQRVNESQKAGAMLAPDLESSLVTFFADSNARLAERFGLDLSVWGHFR